MEVVGSSTALSAMTAGLAVLGDGAPAPLAGRLAELDVEAAEHAADALTAGGLFADGRPLRFAHPAMRAMIYRSLRPGERAIAHRRAVRVLMDAGAAPIAVARHACAVEPAGDPVVADALLAAGRSALASGEARCAARLLERAVAEPPTPGARATVRLLLGRALTLLGDPRAPAVTSASLSDALPADRALLTHELVDALWATGGEDAALSLARQAGGGEPLGIGAARATRDGSLAAAAVAAMAAGGLDGPTAFERCCAIAALIACDELDEAAAALARCTRVAVKRGALHELAVLGRLRARLRAVLGAGSAGDVRIAGPDPGPSPWCRWSSPAAAERFGTPSARGGALLAAEADAGGLERAVALLRGSPRRSELARALLLHGRALRRAGRRCDARVALTEALTLAQRLGAAALANAAREELRVAGARPRREVLTGPDSLTAAERRVADSAAEGRSNREVAEHLFLSTKTIEMHLGRVFRKLEIRSRRELAGALGVVAGSCQARAGVG